MKKTNIGKYVIVRGDRSGVFAGTLATRDGREVQLTDCRRIWYWEGAASISQLGFTTTWDYTTLKRTDCQFFYGARFTTTWDYTTLKPRCPSSGG